MLRWLVANYYRQVAQRLIEGTIEAATKLLTDAEQAVPPEHFRYVIAVGVRLEASAMLARMAPVATSRLPDRVEHWGIADRVLFRVVEVGTSAATASRAIAGLIAHRKPQWVCAAGFAAALTSQYKPGNVVSPARIVDASGQVVDWTPAAWPLERPAPPQAGTLVSLDHVLTTPQQRQHIAEQYQAQFADQETAAIVRACQLHQIPCSIVRVITDAWDDTLPEEVRRWMRQKSWAGKLGALTGTLIHRREKLGELFRLRERAVDYATTLADVFAGQPT